MKQTASIISTYAADVSGVASALFELGGMTVMHDASGCNSTYNTHDEPRWYDTDSLVFLSGLSEMEAVMGDDGKLIDDIAAAAQELRPAFLAVAGTPIPMMVGTDLKAVAAVLEARTGIPSFGFATNGMHSYLSGASMAFAALAKHMVAPVAADAPRHEMLCVNLLGATPLDFSINGSVAAIADAVRCGGAQVISTWAMGSTLAELKRSGSADVNLVVSYCGLAAARILQQRFGTPYVVGVPIGSALTQIILSALAASAADKKCRIAYQAADKQDKKACECDASSLKRSAHPALPVVTLIGESVYSCSLAAALWAERGIPARVLCPLETEPSLLRAQDFVAPDEDDLSPLLCATAQTPASVIVADPLYRPLCPADAAFVPLPHEAFSGRIYRKNIPNLIANFPTFLKSLEKEVPSHD
ncbi:MAG: nitrogenase component 1 [Ruthenibacterium sp.]